jgi:hypothetical protein
MHCPPPPVLPPRGETQKGSEEQQLPIWSPVPLPLSSISTTLDFTVLYKETVLRLSHLVRCMRASKRYSSCDPQRARESVAGMATRSGSDGSGEEDEPLIGLAASSTNSRKESAACRPFLKPVVRILAIALLLYVCCTGRRPAIGVRMLFAAWHEEEGSSLRHRILHSISLTEPIIPDVGKDEVQYSDIAWPRQPRVASSVMPLAAASIHDALAALLATGGESHSRAAKVATPLRRNLTIAAADLDSCKVCTPPDPRVRHLALSIEATDPKEAEAAAAASAAANVAAAVASTSVTSTVSIGQRVRVEWSDHEFHLGTVYDHVYERDPINGTQTLRTCVAYDAEPASLRPCHDMSVVNYELVEAGIFEIAPSPPGLPPALGPPSKISSCCHEGGSWHGKCTVQGQGHPQTWEAATRACNIHACPSCGEVHLSSGILDRNCCNRGGSWYGHCGPPEDGWAFSWKEGFRICR